jgi:hypothetical protein
LGAGQHLPEDWMSDTAPITPNACKTCRHGRPAKAQDGRLDFTQRQCQRYPAQVTTVVFGTPAGQVGIQDFNRWPVMLADDVCGEFSPALSLMS